MVNEGRFDLTSTSQCQHHVLPQELRFQTTITSQPHWCEPAVGAPTARGMRRCALPTRMRMNSLRQAMLMNTKATELGRELREGFGSWIDKELKEMCFVRLLRITGLIWLDRSLNFLGLFFTFGEALLVVKEAGGCAWEWTEFGGQQKQLAAQHCSC